jgi:hypothetical protein
MALRDKIRSNAASQLQPGEVIQAVIPAQTTSGWWALLSYWIIILRNAYRVIVVTDRRILICKSGRFRITPVNAVLREYPRAVRIGPASGVWYRCDSFDETLYIAKRFHKDVTEADAASAGSAPPPGGAPTV